MLALTIAPAASADIPSTSWTPGCWLDTTTPNSQNGVVAGWGYVHCYAFYHDWGGARWNVVFCLQQYVHQDGSWANTYCVYDSSNPEANQGKTGTALLPNQSCSRSGYALYRVKGTLDWFHDGSWERKQDTSSISWACYGYPAYT